MALVQITENTLRAFLADAEITAFDSAGAEGDSPERAGALIRTTCNLVAGIVNASGKYPVLETGQGKVPGGTGTPDACLDTSLHAGRSA